MKSKIQEEARPWLNLNLRITPQQHHSMSQRWKKEEKDKEGREIGREKENGL